VTHQTISPNWDRMTAADRSAWQLIKSWERRGVLVQQAHLASRVN
jgi:hypothetical protein